MISQSELCFDTLMHLFGYDNVWHDPLRAVQNTAGEDGMCLHTLEYIMRDAYRRWRMHEADIAADWTVLEIIRIRGEEV